VVTNPVFLIALYVICWWMALFCVLPIGVQGQHEGGAPERGHDEGAPKLPMLRKKVLWTSLLAIPFWLTAILFVAFDPLRIRS
jgi:predicted secreted protein